MSAGRIDRKEAAVGRAAARRGRRHADVERAAAGSERDLAGGGLPDLSKPIERAEVLRKQAVAAIEVFARTEEEIGRIHEELAAGRPSHRGEYQRTAEQARAMARRAREIVRSFTG